MSRIQVIKGTTKPNFLASEIGLIQNSYTIAAKDFVADEYGFKIAESGTIYPANDATAVGILFEDVDLGLGDHEGSLIVAGRIFKNRLKVEPSAEALAALKESGIIFVNAPETTRGE